MKNKQHILSRTKAVIRTRQVYLKDEQVFLKKENLDILAEESEVAEWFPTDFNWISAST